MITNKSIITYTVLFRFIKFNFKKIIINEDSRAFTKLYLYMFPQYALNFINLMKNIYIISDIVSLNSNYSAFRFLLNSYRLLILQKWLQLIFNNKKNNIYIFNITNAINKLTKYNVIYVSNFV
jgi:hypothetical protein